MLATETRRIFKDGAIIFIVMAAIFSGIIFTDRDAYLAPALEIFLLLYASFAGWSMFERERQENANEYMLSLPLSRSRLLLLKFLPRLLIVSLTLLAYLLLHQSWQLPSFLPPADFSLLFSGFFLLSIAFSLSLKNFISAFFLTCLLSIGQILLIKFLDPGRETGQAILQANLTVLFFPLFFLVLFRNYDIKPVSHFNKKFFPGLLLLAVLIVGAIFLSAPADWKNLALTARGLIMKISCRRSEITIGHARHRFQGCLTALRETADGGAMYGLILEPMGSKAACRNRSLVVINLKTGALKTLFHFAEGWSVAGGYGGEIGVIHNGTYSVLLQNSLLKKAMLLQIHDGKVRKIPITGDFYDAKISYVFYLNGDSPQFVIFSEPRLYRLDSSGRVEELAASKSLNVWQDKVLVFDSSGMNLYRIGAGLTLLRKWQGKYKKILRRISGYESRGVIYHTNRDYFWLDMEQKESKLDLPSPPYTYQQNGDDFNVVFASGSAFTIMNIRSGKRSETIWELGFQPSGIRISPFGLLAFKEQKYKVYPFKN